MSGGRARAAGASLGRAGDQPDGAHSTDGAQQGGTGRVFAVCLGQDLGGGQVQQRTSEEAEAAAGRIPEKGSGATDGPAAGPRGLVVGVGASRGVPADEVHGLIEEALREAGLSTADVAALATVDVRAAEPGLLGAAERLGVPLWTYGADRLARVPVQNPSHAALRAVGTPSVAEAAALASGGELLVPKRRSAPSGRPAGATCAIARPASPTSSATAVTPPRRT